MQSSDCQQDTNSACRQRGARTLDKSLIVCDLHCMLIHFYELNRLYRNIVKRLRSIFHFLEIDVFEVDASDIAVPCCSVIESKSILIGCCCHLCCAWQSFRNVGFCMLTTDWNIKIIQDVKGLDNCIKAGA